MSQKSTWKIYYNYLNDYYTEHGNPYLPVDYTINNKNVYKWLRNQIYLYQNNSLSSSKIKLLKLLDIPLEDGLEEGYWNYMYSIAEKYYKCHKTLVMSDNEVFLKQPLGKWLSCQRRNRKYLTAEKIQKLNDIEMIWNLKEYKWQMHYLYLKQYYEKHGNVFVNYGYTVNGYNIYNWLLKQMNLYKTGELLVTKAILLRKINVPMELTYKMGQWEYMFSIAEKYFQENGNLNIVNNIIYLNENLGEWVQKQRDEKNKLTQDQIEKLNSIKMKWTYQDALWEVYYSFVLEFYNKNGHSNISTTYMKDGYRVGRWFLEQSRNKDKLSEDQIKKLDAVKIKWDTPKIKRKYWKDGFKAASIYYYLFQHLYVTEDFIINGINVKEWLKVQRNHKDKLTKKQIEDLDSIGMIWNMKEYGWECHYKIAKDYYLTHGDLAVPSKCVYKGYNLYNWISQQRYYYSLGKLSEKKIELLNKIGMIWDYKKYKERIGQIDIEKLQYQKKQIKRELLYILDRYNNQTLLDDETKYLITRSVLRRIK